MKKILTILFALTLLVTAVSAFETKSPLANQTYDSTNISLSIASNDTYQNISYVLNDNEQVLLCENCSNTSSFIDAVQGNNTLNITGFKENESVSEITIFDVELAQENESSRFTEGFQHLPKAVQRGELTDEELANIIKNNDLNPGIVNRLIKTGMLENESINAILETQFNPPGILRRLVSFFGIQQDSYSSLIYENYELSEEAQNKLLVREDLPKTKAKELREKVRERLTPIRGSSNSPLAQDNTSDEVVSQERGKNQQNKIEESNVGRQNSEDKGRAPLNVGRQNGFVPPGQAKRN